MHAGDCVDERSGGMSRQSDVGEQITVVVWVSGLASAPAASRGALTAVVATTVSVVLHQVQPHQICRTHDDSGGD